MVLDKTFNFKDVEPKVSKMWFDTKAFEAGLKSEKSKKSFCVLIPPPNVTGSLHMGHAFNNTLQDILVRWHRMRGYDTLWQPGQDHAGIATQMVVERELANKGLPSRQELGREKFLEKVWEWKNVSGNTIIDQLKRLGASCDWERNRFTMDDGFQHAVISVFVELYKKGIIYKGKRLVNWDTHFESAISDLEVENIETDGKFWHIKYFLTNNNTYEYQEKDSSGTVTFKEERNYITIATTRPETMFGDCAVAVHPSDERYQAIVGQKLSLPLSGREIPIIPDEYPDPKFGSGAVKITGAHDFNDYEVAKRHNLDLLVLMDKKGRFLEENFIPDRFHKLDRFEVREKVLEDLNKLHFIANVEDKKIIQPVGDRSQTIIEPMLTEQWFVDTNKVVKPAIDAVKTGKTKIYPKQDEKVYFHWLENIEPWCISRQLWWGHQVPVWYDDEGNEYCAHSEKEAKSMAPGRELKRDPDVLDTWFSSGLWPIGTLGWPEKTIEMEKYFPTSVLVTGFDIIFFWVARMMMMQLAVVGQVPFKEVYVHALVRDEKGKKMSKSLGNVLDPLTLIEKYGADSVRFTLTSMAAMGRDLKLSESRIEGYRNFATKLWNAARFLEFHDCRVSPIDIGNVKDNINQWMINEVIKGQDEIDNALETYKFNEAADVLYRLVWGKFCDWYIEFSKILLRESSDEIINETKSTLSWVLENILRLMHPFMPFITEKIWGDLQFSSNPLVNSKWPKLDKSKITNSKSLIEVEWIIDVVQKIRSLRAEMRIDPGIKIPIFVGSMEQDKIDNVKKWGPQVCNLGRISSIGIGKPIPRGCASIIVDNNELHLAISEVMDLQDEIKRLEKNLSRNRSELSSFESKLGNEKFINNAPQEVVEEARSRAITLSEESIKIRRSIERLSQMID